MKPAIEKIPESTINGLNKVFEKKTFRYSGPVILFSRPPDSKDIEFDYTLNIVGQKQMITIGDWKNYVVVDVYIKNYEGPYSILFDKLYNTDSFKMVLNNKLTDVFSRLGFTQDFYINLNEIHLE